MKRYRDSDNNQKMSTPSGHRGRQIELEKMSGNGAQMDLTVADTSQARKSWTILNSEAYFGRPSRDIYRKFDW